MISLYALGIVLDCMKKLASYPRHVTYLKSTLHSQMWITYKIFSAMTILSTMGMESSDMEFQEAGSPTSPGQGPGRVLPHWWSWPCLKMNRPDDGYPQLLVHKMFFSVSHFVDNSPIPNSHENHPQIMQENSRVSSPVYFKFYPIISDLYIIYSHIHKQRFMRLSFKDFKIEKRQAD
ncbi:MAG: hypothetical protein H7833_14585 [Magnetococcus sp. DMHC-1]